MDYLGNRYKKRFPTPRKIEAVSIDTGTSVEILSVDFLNALSFVVDGMEEDLIFPQFCRRGGKSVIQGFEVLSLFSVFRYLARRFNYKETILIRQGTDLVEGKNRWKRRTIKTMRLVLLNERNLKTF